jgi:hypothetical protein
MLLPVAGPGIAKGLQTRLISNVAALGVGGMCFTRGFIYMMGSMGGKVNVSAIPSVAGAPMVNEESGVVQRFGEGKWRKTPHCHYREWKNRITLLVRLMVRRTAFCSMML